MGITSEYLCCSDESATIDTRALPPYHTIGGAPFNGVDNRTGQPHPVLLQEALPIHRFGCHTWGKIMHYCTSDALGWWDKMAARASKPVTLYFLCEDSDKRYFSIHLDPAAKHASWAAADEDQVTRQLLRGPKRPRPRLTQPKRARLQRQRKRQADGRRDIRLLVSTKWDGERWNGLPDVKPERFAKALPAILRRFHPVCTDRTSWDGM